MKRKICLVMIALLGVFLWVYVTRGTPVTPVATPVATPTITSEPGLQAELRSGGGVAQVYLLRFQGIGEPDEDSIVLSSDTQDDDNPGGDDYVFLAVKDEPGTWLLLVSQEVDWITNGSALFVQEALLYHGGSTIGYHQFKVIDGIRSDDLFTLREEVPSHMYYWGERKVGFVNGHLKGPFYSPNESLQCVRVTTYSNEDSFLCSTPK